MPRAARAARAVQRPGTGGETGGQKESHCSPPAPQASALSEFVIRLYPFRTSPAQTDSTTRLGN